MRLHSVDICMICSGRLAISLNQLIHTISSVKYVTIDAIEMKYEKGPVRSLKSMASSTCSSFALTIQLRGIDEGNVCIMIDILNGYAVQNA